MCIIMNVSNVCQTSVVTFHRFRALFNIPMNNVKNRRISQGNIIFEQERKRYEIRK